MLRRRWLPLLATLLGLAMAVPAPAATLIFPPGQRVGLEPAADLRPSTHFPGFEDIDRKVVVTILELPAAAYDQISGSLVKDSSGGADPAGVKREDFPFAGGKGLLIRGTAKDDGAPVQRWFLVANPAVAGGEKITMLIRVDVPETARETYTDAAVRKMLATVDTRRVPVEEMLGLLPFKLADLAGFRVVKVAPGAVILTDGPSDNVAKQSFAIVSVGRGAPDSAADRGHFAREVLASAPVRDLTVTSAEPMRVSGAPGYEIRAKAENAGGEPVTLVQWIRFGGSGFLGIVGIARTGEWDATFNRFRALRDGAEFR